MKRSLINFLHDWKVYESSLALVSPSKTEDFSFHLSIFVFQFVFKHISLIRIEYIWSWVFVLHGQVVLLSCRDTMGI